VDDRLAPTFVVNDLAELVEGDVGVPRFGILSVEGVFMMPAFSKEAARIYLGNIEDDLVEGEREILLRQIEASGLQEELMEHDRRVFASLEADVDMLKAVGNEEVELVRQFFQQDRVGLQLVIVFGTISIMLDPNFNPKPVYEIRMPKVSDEGNHPIILILDGEVLMEASVSRRRQTRELIKRWARKFRMQRREKRRLRAIAVQMLVAHNRELAVRRREQAN
jgi:hypothetical protein